MMEMVMRCFAFDNLRGLRSRLGLSIVFAGLFLAVAVQATEVESLIGKLPRAYLGRIRLERRQYRAERRYQI